MNVETLRKRLPQLRNFCDMGEQPQLDLRIIGGNQLVPRRGDKSGADFTAGFIAHGDVLQVRLARRQAPGGGGGERIRGVDAVGARVDIGWQGVGIGRFQLGQPTPFENAGGKRIALLGQIIQHRGGGRPRPRRGLFCARQPHFAKQDIAKLLGRTKVEFFPGQNVNIRLEPRHVLRELARKPRQDVPVNRNAAPLHPRQHIDELALQRLVNG